MNHIVKNRGDTYTATLSSDGDHIVCKHNKHDVLHAFQVEHGTGTWTRVVAIVENLAQQNTI